MDKRQLFLMNLWLEIKGRIISKAEQILMQRIPDGNTLAPGFTTGEYIASPHSRFAYTFDGGIIIVTLERDSKDETTEANGMSYITSLGIMEWYG